MNSRDRFDLVIAGGGQAAARLISQLRRLGDERSVRLIGAERHPPYERPPLSKGYLLGSVPRAKLTLADLDTLDKLAVDFVAGERVVAIDPDARTVTTAAGHVTTYGDLVLAVGATARHLPVPGADAERIVRLRGVDDSDRLRTALEAQPDVVVVGGGYLGLELAAAARELGCTVSVIEFQPQLLARVMPDGIGTWFRDLHVRHGVAVHTATTVRAYAETATGIVVETDAGEFAGGLVIEAAGAAVDSAFAGDAERLPNGALIVDGDFRTSLPGVCAIGDAAAQRGTDGEVRHDQSYQFANVSGEALARQLAGAPPAAPQPDYFWSDQYDAKLQSVGRWNGASIWIERRGEDALALFAVDATGALTGIVTVNMPRDMGAARKLVAAGTRVAAERLADPGEPLKGLVG